MNNKDKIERLREIRELSDKEKSENFNEIMQEILYDLCEDEKRETEQ
jgi:hypothetical protein